MSKEVAQQYDMFTGELVDTRSTNHKPKESQVEKPKQVEMFATREVAQFGVHMRPSLPMINSRAMPIGMVLAIQDPRTQEEKEYDQMKAAEAITYKLFDSKQPMPIEKPQRTKYFPSGLVLELREIEAEVPNIAVHLDEGIDLPFWSSRDEGVAWAELEIRRRGYIPRLIQDNQLELHKADESGSFLITYSRLTDASVNAIEDVEWINNNDLSSTEP